MADTTGIEWTDATWNPIVGCSITSPGCAHCYAMPMAARIAHMQPRSHYADMTQPSAAGAVWTGKVTRAPDNILTAPLRWRKGRRIFVNSMGDLFHESVQDEWIDRVFAIMALCPQHTFQVLTKRSARMRAYASGPKSPIRIAEIILLESQAWGMKGKQMLAPLGNRPREEDPEYVRWPLPNVWLGVTAEDQTRADERIPDLLATPAAIRFVSCEPLLGGLDLTQVGNLSSIRASFPGLIEKEERRRPRNGNGSISGYQIDAIGNPGSSIEFFQTPDHMGGFSATSPRQFPRIDLVIAGGESGPRARPMHPDWARTLRDQCATVGVPFFFKQWGEWEAAVDRERDDPDWRLNYSGTFADAGKTKWLNLAGGRGFHGEQFHVMRRVGKARTGRLLDGIEHNAMPERKPA